MNEKKALLVLSSIKLIAEPTWDDIIMEAIDVAIAALEKQIPKKMDYEGDGCDNAGNIIFDTAICPGCGKMFEIDYDDNVNYCPDCGQRLKWEEMPL